MCVRSLHLILPFYFLLYLPHLFLFLNYMKSIVNLHNSCIEYFIANQLKKKCKKRDYLGIHNRFIRDTWFRKTMLELGRTEEVIREMDKLANEDHTHIATEEELNYIVAIGGYVRILLVPTRCP